ncbi:hypothetical protein NHX12_034500 [Muraenolepis orangiensis]|uniref:Uncharacterized protein n=1 Tax=Muraenolepis orangiensis TaxID=630683 RepID=A0A9Q0D9T4_9TELE|nr:hypothetical protein NHX12_034500 [Muraenolepis orangiensis]
METSLGWRRDGDQPGVEERWSLGWVGELGGGRALHQCKLVQSHNQLYGNDMRLTRSLYDRHPEVGSSTTDTLRSAPLRQTP